MISKKLPVVKKLKLVVYFCVERFLKKNEPKVATANYLVMHALNEPYIGGGKPIFLQALYYLTQSHGRY